MKKQSCKHLQSSKSQSGKPQSSRSKVKNVQTKK